MMQFLKFFLILTTAFFLAACDSELREAEKLYQQSQSLHLKTASTLTDPLGEAIRILEGYLARNPDEPRATLLLWRCYLQAGHPRAQALCDNVRKIPEPMRRIFPTAIRRELDASMREQMVYLFGEIATPQEAKALIKILERDSATNVQRAAAEVLARINAAAAIPSLLRKLPVSQPAVRLYACRALSSFPQPEVTQALVSRLQDFQEIPEVRQQAAQSLAQICQRQFEGKAILLQQLERLLRDEACPLLTRLLVASTLAALGQTTGYDLAMACATSADPFIRGVAIVTLGYIGDHLALPHLTDALANGNKALRLQAAEALGRLGDAKALPSLYKAMDDPSEAVRAAANQAIAQIKSNG
jgi:HEAT repeat protein